MKGTKDVSILWSCNFLMYLFYFLFFFLMVPIFIFRKQTDFSVNSTKNQRNYLKIKHYTSLGYSEGYQSHSKCLAFLGNVVLVQSLSPVWRFATPWTAEHQASLSFTVSRSSLSLRSISRWCHPTISSSVPSSPPALNLSQHQSLFQWVGSLHQAAQSTGASVSTSVLPMNIQGWFHLSLTDLISLLLKGLLRVFSSTTFWKLQFFSTQPSLCSNSHIWTWLLERPELWLYGDLSAKWCLCFLISCLGLS